MSLSLKGKLIRILAAESGIARSGNAWKKQEFVVETQDQFPKKVCFSLFNDKTSLLTGCTEGDDIEVNFDIESREFNSKWYHNLNAWKIERLDKNLTGGIPPPFLPDDIPPESYQEQPGDLPF